MVNVRETELTFEIENNAEGLVLVQAIGNDHYWKDWHEHELGAKYWGVKTLKDYVNDRNEYSVSKKPKDKILTKEDIEKTAISRGIVVKFIKE